MGLFGKLFDKKECDICGAPVEGDKFCTNCGSPLS